MYIKLHSLKFNICVAVFLVKFSSTILKQCPLHFNNTQTFNVYNITVDSR